jgi:hypothetical protein
MGRYLTARRSRPPWQPSCPRASLFLFMGLIEQQLIAVKQVESPSQRSIMQRLFFDYVSKNETLSDYEGRYFSPSEAREYAGVLAIHLQYAPEAKYSGWSVVVRDVLGAEICSVPVPPNEDQGVVFKALPSDAIGSRGSDLQVR